MTRGILIVLEGIDGAGTTTQSRRLVGWLNERGVRAHLTREPSDGPIGLLLREILVGGHQPTDATTLSLLFAADRADHVQREVEPALTDGIVVVSDRWYHSSLAYQGTGEDRDWIRELNRRALAPDLTVFLEVEPEVAAKRRAAAERTDEIFDRFETQQRIADAYRAVISALRETERIEVVDGEANVDSVAKAISELARETCAAAGLGPTS